VLVLEARGRVGGRAWHGRSDRLGLDVEFGGQYIDPIYHPFTKGLIERYELGVTDVGLQLDGLEWSLGGERLSGWPVPQEDLADLATLLYWVSHGARRLDLSRPFDRQDVADLDVSFEEFLGRLDIGEPTKRFARVIAEGYSGRTPSDWAVIELLNWIAGFGGNPWLFWVMQESRYVAGSTAGVEAMIVDGSPDIALSSPVLRVAQTSSGVRIECENGDVHNARAAVMALPLACLADITFTPGLSRLRCEGASAAGIGRSVKVFSLIEGDHSTMVWGDQPGLKYAHPYKRIAEGTIITSFASADEIDFTDHGAVEQSMRTLIPHAKLLRYDYHDWLSDPRAKSAWFCWRPGWGTRLHSSLQQPEGLIAFASGDTANASMGSFESAMESGAAAALQTLAALSDPR
jgi:monoamine oxidase